MVGLTKKFSMEIPHQNGSSIIEASRSNLTSRQAIARILSARMPVLLVLIVSIVVTLWGWRVAREFETQHVEGIFAARVFDLEVSIAERLIGFEDALYASRAFVLASPRISREEWLLFQDSQRFETNYPGSLGIGIAYAIDAANLDEYVRSVRARDNVDYTVWPSGNRPEYAPVRFAASHNRDRKARGFDLYSDPNRLAAMQRARDTGEPTATTVLTLVRDKAKDDRDAVVLFLPVYDKSLPSMPTVAQRRSALRAYVYCPLLVDAFLRHVAQKSSIQRIAWRLHDEDGRTIASTFSEETPAQDARTRIVDRPTYGRNWRLEARALPGFEGNVSDFRAVAVLAAGVVLGLLFVTVVWAVTSTRLRAETLARNMTRELRESEARFRSLTALSADWYWETDEAHRFTADSGGGQGWSMSAIKTVVGKTRWELPVAGMTEEDWDAHRAVLAAHQPFSDFRFKRFDNAGVLRHISVSGTPFTDENGLFKGYRGVGRDVTDRVLAEEQVQFLAYHDNLTALPNRAAFNLLLNHQVRQATRNRQCLAVLFVDLDRFKVINDSLGHDVGDAVLREVASRLKSSVRNNDTVSRWGGDEFVVLLENISGATDAALVAQKILDNLNVPSEVLTKDFPVTPSIGIGVFPQDGADEEAILKCADLAMYEAKERGRNNYQFYFPELNAEAGLRLQLEAGLRAALEKNEFVVHFQPKVTLSDGIVCGLEALIRWQPPDREMVSPAQFIPLLESTGLIVAVGEWVLRAVCAQIKSWSSTGVEVVPVSVNLSLRQLEHEAFLATTESILREYQVDAALIKFEITETMLMRKPDEVVKALTDLARLGFALSVDDFGTGYSSLGYLKRFPLRELKIDRSFINDVEVNADSAAIVVATIDLAHNLHLKVVAEGVETAAQLLFLRSHGCDEMQGYFFSKPLPIPECTVLLESKKRLDLKALLPADSTPVVLLVDDSQLDLKLMKRILLPLNCKVVVASSAREAFSVLAQNRVVAIVSDQNMPKVTGVALMSSMRTLYPDVARVLMSGNGGKEALADGVNVAGIHKFLDKGWPADRIRSAMHEVLQGRSRESG